MPRKAIAARPRSTAEQLQAFLKEEYTDDAKFTQNIVRPSCFAMHSIS